VFALSSTAVLGLVLLATPANAASQAPFPSCEVGTRYIELEADAPGRAPEVCIRPEVSTTLFFDTALARVEVEDRELFRRVKVADDTLTLLPSEALHDGARVPVVVYFQDDAAPVSATFLLVVHPSQAERQVEVSRHARTVSSYQQGEQQARAEAQRCWEDKALLQAEFSGQGGLSGLIARGWLDKKGVVTKDISNTITQRLGSILLVQNVISYRAVGPGRRGRVAVEMELQNRGAVDWKVMGAALMGAKGETLTGLTVWLDAPISPGKFQRLVVEMDATENELRGAFTLKLWSGEAGAGGVILDGVTWP
jgi:uncharacterized protein (TIGR02268 family)